MKEDAIGEVMSDCVVDEKVVDAVVDAGRDVEIKVVAEDAAVVKGTVGFIESSPQPQASNIIARHKQRMRFCMGQTSFKWIEKPLCYLAERLGNQISWQLSKR